MSGDRNRVLGHVLIYTPFVVRGRYLAATRLRLVPSLRMRGVVPPLVAREIVA